MPRRAGVSNCAKLCKFFFNPRYKIAALQFCKLDYFSIFLEQLRDFPDAVKLVGHENNDRRRRGICEIAFENGLEILLERVAGRRVRYTHIRHPDHTACRHHRKLVGRRERVLYILWIVKTERIVIEITQITLAERDL